MVNSHLNPKKGGSNRFYFLQSNLLHYNTTQEDSVDKTIWKGLLLEVGLVRSSCVRKKLGIRDDLYSKTL